MTNFFKTYWRTLSILLLILYASTTRSTPSIGITLLLPHFDKIVHFGMYSVLSFTACFDRRNQTDNHAHLVLSVIILSSLYGIIMELLQEYFFPPRTGSIYDCLANCIGCLAGCALFLIYNYLKSKRS